MATRNAELEQAARTARPLIRDGTVILTLGGVLISFAGLCAADSTRWCIAGIGGGLLISGLWIVKILNGSIWPQQPPAK